MYFFLYGWGNYFRVWDVRFGEFLFIFDENVTLQDALHLNIAVKDMK